ncbi:hypothetical protein [Dyadobacter sp. BHUBP1]|uniref:hypothetical protein n=1 Tax=Dyadobacter sp. BHUBP1 TaxID=3424178 RepID=UPI003D355FF5
MPLAKAAVTVCIVENYRQFPSPLGNAFPAGIQAGYLLFFAIDGKWLANSKVSDTLLHKKGCFLLRKQPFY